MAAVTGQAVADLLGRGDEPAVVALAEHHVEVVETFVKSYTRGRGFVEPGPPPDLAPDLAAVIRSAAARLTANPEQLEREQAGTYSVAYPRLDGWSLPELAVLHAYRRRTA